MGKHDQVSAAAAEARRATGGAAGRGRGGRFSARRKRETVLRLLRGEDLESVSRARLPAIPRDSVRTVA